MKSQRLPDTEFEIMSYIWECTPPVTTGMIMEKMGRERGWRLQTVVTLFTRLMERGFLRSEKGKGREHAFYPLISRDEYLRMETDSFVNRYQKKSILHLVTTLSSEDVSQEELSELSSWLDRAKEGKMEK